MMIKQGEIYLVDFGKKYNSEIGKIRPALILQNNFFNKALKNKVYRQVLVVPLSTLPIADDFRIFIKARDNLKKDSYIITNWICTLDFEHILIDKGLIAKLNNEELSEVKKRVCTLM